MITETGPCCDNCWLKTGCETVGDIPDTSTDFCSKWRSIAPPHKGPDPNELWRDGDGDAP